MVRRFSLQREEVPSGDSSVNYREHLNEQQYRAATAGDGPMLVVAGAGTGKTRTLVYRVAYLVDTGIPPEDIVLLTFTRRAANEMLQRAARVLDSRCQEVRGGTFHAFCASTLRKYARLIDFSTSFTIIDTEDAADVLDMLRIRRGLHTSEERFPRKQTLRAMFSAVVNRRISLSELIEKEYRTYAGHLEQLEQLAEDYRQYKQDKSLMDYDDLLWYTRKLFETVPEVRRRVSARCRHVLVDEYQDTNRLQAELVEDFSAVHKNVMVVGDDAQSIYGFRGADYKNIFRFRESFDRTQVVKLEQNYRSTQPILDLANEVIAQADDTFEKQLYSCRKGGDRPVFVQAADESLQSRFVAQMILTLREENLDLDRLAVLFRRSSDSYALESELDRRDIPFVKYGGPKLVETAHIKDILAHLRVVENPNDEVAWNRVLQLLHGIGPKTARDMIEWIGRAEEPFTFDRAYTSGRYMERLGELANMLQVIHSEELSVEAHIEAIADYYRPALEQKYADDYEERWRDVERFIGLAEQYSDRQELLERLAIDPISLTAVDNSGADEEEASLVLSTIHSAKGLEFHTVFLIQAIDGALPSSYALKEDGDLDEELRLLYVAITRAEEQLFITYPVLQYRSGTGTYMTKPSRFLDDIPEQYLEPGLLVEDEAKEIPGSDEDADDSSALPDKSTVDL